MQAFAGDGAAQIGNQIQRRMTHFINGDGLAPRSPARKQSHKGKKQNHAG